MVDQWVAHKNFLEVLMFVVPAVFGACACVLKCVGSRTACGREAKRRMSARCKKCGVDVCTEEGEASPGMSPVPRNSVEAAGASIVAEQIRIKAERDAALKGKLAEKRADQVREQAKLDAARARAAAAESDAQEILQRRDSLSEEISQLERESLQDSTETAALV